MTKLDSFTRAEIATMQRRIDKALRRMNHPEISDRRYCEEGARADRLRKAIDLLTLKNTTNQNVKKEKK